MKEEVNVKLIDGQFTSAEATSILLTLLNDKINHHTVEVLSYKERHGKEETHSRKRVEELNASVEELKILLNEAKKTSKSLMIKSEIKICFLD
ncbi:MAG: hypothetical protein GC193_10255 [Cryomorphaceae bacterium]|nr:hypothetical protein [Cryomorphaceae bacterium]